MLLHSDLDTATTQQYCMVRTKKYEGGRNVGHMFGLKSTTLDPVLIDGFTFSALLVYAGSCRQVR